MIQDSDLEGLRLHAAVEELRRYLAGPCTEECVAHGQVGSLADSYNGHRHWTEWYEDHRWTVVALNAILEGDYAYPVVLNSVGR